MVAECPEMRHQRRGADAAAAQRARDPPPAACCLLRPSATRRRRPRPPPQAFVRLKPGDDNITISLTLGGRQRNLNRCVGLPREVVQRLGFNILVYG